VVSENVPLYDKLMRSPASRASINVYCGLSDIAAFMDSVKTLLKPMSDELKQFVALTSATSSGFANVMSTH
jgi:hypothetical protein